MTRPDLDAIEARERAATPGPWAMRGADFYGSEPITSEADGYPGAPIVEARPVLIAENTWHGVIDWPRDADAQFIIHARTDVPTLVARVRELEAAARRAVDECGAEVCGRDALRALDDLEAVLDAKETP